MMPVRHRWVLLRGLAREAGHWYSFPQVLHRHLGDGHEIVTLDLPGCGRLHAQRSPISVDGMVQACRAQLAALPPGSPVRIVAVSLAGMVALRWALLAHAEVAGCALVNTSVGGLSPLHQRLRPANWRALLALMRPGLSTSRREEQILWLTTADALRHRDALREFARLAGAFPVSRMTVMRQLVAAARFRLDGAAPAVPILLLASRADALVDAACTRDLARAWAMPLREHPWAGHDLPLDDPRWLARQLAQWFDGTT